MITFLALYGAAFLISFIIMLFLWVAYRTQRSAGIVDIGWCLCFVLTAWACFLIGDGAFLKRLVMTAMVTIWGGRLGWHLYRRYLKSSEDPRYAKMRTAWGGDPSDKLFLMMFLFQAILVVLISTPIITVAAFANSEWSYLEPAAMIVWFIGVAGESFADRQLSDFKADPANQGKVCDCGLWKYSRHPNYFFEFIIWIGFFLFAYSSTGGFIAVISPIIIYGLLVKGSGIPLAEEQSLQTHGDAYKEYQLRTSPFFPWFSGPKKP